MLGGSWLDANSGGHWSFFAGPPRLIDQRLYPYTNERRSVRSTRETRIADVDARVIFMAPYPQGGVNGGHVVVRWRVNRTDYLVSLHGYANELRAIAIAEALIGEL